MSFTGNTCNWFPESSSQMTHPTHGRWQPQSAERLKPGPVQRARKPERYWRSPIPGERRRHHNLKISPALDPVNPGRAQDNQSLQISAPGQPSTSIPSGRDRPLTWHPSAVYADFTLLNTNTMNLPFVPNPNFLVANRVGPTVQPLFHAHGTGTILSENTQQSADSNEYYELPIHQPQPFLRSAVPDYLEDVGSAGHDRLPEPLLNTEARWRKEQLSPTMPTSFPNRRKSEPGVELVGMGLYEKSDASAEWNLEPHSYIFTGDYEPFENGKGLKLEEAWHPSLQQGEYEQELDMGSLVDDDSSQRQPSQEWDRTTSFEMQLPYGDYSQTLSSSSPISMPGYNHLVEYKQDVFTPEGMYDQDKPLPTSDYLHFGGYDWTNEAELYTFS